MTQRKPVVSSRRSAVFGVVPVMAGESEAHFQAGLEGLMQELQVTTVLLRYLAEKIHECLWWMRHYQAQKRVTIVAEMSALAKGSCRLEVTPTEEHIRNLLPNNQTDETLRMVQAEIRHTPEPWPTGGQFCSCWASKWSFKPRFWQGRRHHTKSRSTAEPMPSVCSCKTACCVATSRTSTSIARTANHPPLHPMVILEQRAANRRNALKSTGCRSAMGNRASAANAVRHGLTVPVSASPWGNHLAAVQYMLQTDCFTPYQSQPLALAVLDFARNLHHQRNRYFFSLGLPAKGLNPAVAGQEERQMAHALMADRPARRSCQPGVRRKAAAQVPRFLHMVGQREQRSAEQGLRNADRHLRRAANQLIKACSTAF